MKNQKGSDSHFEVLNVSGSWLAQKLRRKNTRCFVPVNLQFSNFLEWLIYLWIQKLWINSKRIEKWKDNWKLPKWKLIFINDFRVYKNQLLSNFFMQFQWLLFQCRKPTRIFIHLRLTNWINSTNFERQGTNPNTLHTT